ncbi:nitroreductase family deazaflavin-dependent oxidoreductase [Amycolatopsis suaedae]|uniref:Nitroreductase family deazaflavin-dependent oxidoreductase n=2 Tax=Amycolatopsis suaedae TaxID=2510978 RepID=A0A4Q7J9T3_9PSEU|nr:nitroreductase family deazaflavin-dependent oxidoreductase [Amycolatopsis suaedae]
MRIAPWVPAVDHWLHRVTRGRLALLDLAGLPSLRLETTGRRSGLRRASNLLYCPDGEDYVLVASNWGKPNDPGWAHNLRACPEATVLLRGRAVPVLAREVTGEEYDAWWPRLVRFWPGYAMERRLAGRRLPIFVLTGRYPE